MIILETYRVNKNNYNSIDNGADVGNDGVPDDNDNVNVNYGVIYDRNDDANPPSLPSLPPISNIPCIHSIIGEVDREFQFWTNIPNGEPYGDNDNTYNDTVPNQANNNNKTIILDEYNTISPIEREVNKEYLFWKTSSNNNHNQDLEICHDDHYRVHSEPVGCNPSKIPNDGERIVLLSLVSRGVILSSMSAVKSEEVKNKEVKNHYVNSNFNLNKILQIVLSIFLQLGCEWTLLKKYRVDNDSKIEWTLKKYQDDNDSKIDWFLKWYRVDNDGETAFNEQSKGSKATFQVVRNNNSFSDGGLASSFLS